MLVFDGNLALYVYTYSTRIILELALGFIDYLSIVDSCNYDFGKGYGWERLGDIRRRCPQVRV